MGRKECTGQRKGREAPHQAESTANLKTRHQSVDSLGSCKQLREAGAGRTAVGIKLEGCREALYYGSLALILVLQQQEASREIRECVYRMCSSRSFRAGKRVRFLFWERGLWPQTRVALVPSADKDWLRDL